MFERGDLLLIPYPFTDLSAAKRRPVLALTGPDTYGDFIALPVTSRLQKENSIALASVDLIRGNVPVQSWIRIDRIVTLNASLIVKTIGTVSAGIVDAAVEGFCARIRAPARR